MRLKALVIAAALLFGPACAPRVSGQTVADMADAGRAPLSQTDAVSVARLYEWALAVAFTPGERETFQELFARAWGRNERGAATLLRLAKKVASMDEARRTELRQEFHDALLSDIKSAPETEANRFLLGVYEKAHGGAPAPAEGSPSGETETAAGAEPEAKGEAGFKTVEGAVRLSDLAGKWEKGGVSSYGYRDAVTNDYRSGYGSANMHEIKADGSFDYSNYATVSLYDCKTELFTSMKGRVSVSGPRVTFTYVSGTVRGKDSCKAEGFNKPARIEPKTYRVERDGERLRLCEDGTDTPSCLYKAK